jgi:hypothetical protein
VEIVLGRNVIESKLGLILQQRSKGRVGGGRASCAGRHAVVASWLLLGSVGSANLIEGQGEIAGPDEHGSLDDIVRLHRLDRIDDVFQS